MGTRRVTHPQDGTLVYEHVTLCPVGRSDYKRVMLLGPQAP